ncbi:unnamed protein product, partial [Mesorhabditis belari]|uniref:Uncharacterized protein n=1 Tax=Mesorhabditis belari TaxID=2138241 RepID=A0AAF3FRV1_9BILA
MSCKYFLLLILLTCKVGLSERCMNVNSRRDFDSCQTWILYLFFILNPSTAYDQEYKGMVIFAENILNLCKDEMARKGSVNYIVELTPDGGIRARDVLNSTMEYYEFYERSRLQRSSNLSAQLELAREMVKQHNVTTDGEAVYLLTNVPCERIAANPQLYGGLADFINLMPTFTDVPYQLLWITTYMDDAWNFSKETLYSLGMCFMNPNVSMAPDITIGFFEILSTTVLPDDYHYKGIYIGLIVFIWLIAALSVFFTVRRLFYREWRPWTPFVYDSWEIQRDSLEISEKKLGAGAYAVVYEATLKGYPPAVKAIEA